MIGAMKEVIGAMDKESEEFVEIMKEGREYFGED